MLPSPTLLNQVENFIKNQRNKGYFCLFLLGKEVGLRVSEAVNFDLSLKKSQNLYLIHGKKHKKRHVFIDPAVTKTLKENAWSPKKTNRFSFAHFLQKTKKELGISTSIELTPHTLRRCFTTYQAKAGMTLPTLQKVLGHSSIRTTALYWKDSEDPREKDINDKWLKGKVPKEPKKNQPQEPPKLPTKENYLVNNWEIFLNIQQETNIFIPNNPKNSDQKLLETEKKILQEKVKQLEQEKTEQQQIITNLKNDKELLEKELVQVQEEKRALLKILSTDLKRQEKSLSQLDNKQVNNQELHQQLIAQIEVINKNS